MGQHTNDQSSTTIARAWLQRLRTPGHDLASMGTAVSAVPSSVHRARSSDQLMADLMAAGPEVRTAVAGLVDDRDAGALDWVAHHLAEFAVRSGDPGPLDRALLALTLSFEGTRDWRDTLHVLALPWDAAERLGEDPGPRYERAADLMAGKGGEFLRSFARRRPEDRTIGSMGYVAQDGTDGFEYVWLP